MVFRNCSVFPLCLECLDHDQFDCEFMQKAVDVSRNILISNYPAYGALKYLLMLENPSTNSKELTDVLKMTTHLEEYKMSDDWEEHKTTLVDPILNSGIVKHFARVTVDEELLLRICYFIDLNSYEITNQYGNQVRGVYCRAPTIPHSCMPNTLLAVDDDFKLKIYATLPIRRGESIFNSYTNPLMGTSQRQHHLMMTKYVMCSCKRCEDPTELGTFLSSIKCKQCTDGYASLMNGTWICNSCKLKTNHSEVQDLLSEVAEHLFTIEGDILEYETLLDKYADNFHPNHFLIIDIKQNIASILRAVLMNPLRQPERSVLKRKIELCEQMLPVVRAIQPGISRIYAIALYEFVITFMELIQHDVADGKITSDEYKAQLLRAKTMSTEAIKMLEFEPLNSPEGLLRQRIAMELEQIEQQLAGL